MPNLVEASLDAPQHFACRQRRFVRCCCTFSPKKCQISTKSETRIITELITCPPQLFNLQPWWWNPQVLPKRWHLSSKLHGVISKYGLPTSHGHGREKLVGDREACFVTTLSITKIMSVVSEWNEYGAVAEWKWQGKTEVLWEKSVPVP